MGAVGAPAPHRLAWCGPPYPPPPMAVHPSGRGGVGGAHAPGAPSGHPRRHAGWGGVRGERGGVWRVHGPALISGPGRVPPSPCSRIPVPLVPCANVSPRTHRSPLPHPHGPPSTSGPTTITTAGPPPTTTSGGAPTTSPCGGPDHHRRGEGRPTTTTATTARTPATTATTEGGRAAHPGEGGRGRGSAGSCVSPRRGIGRCNTK